MGIILYHLLLYSIFFYDPLDLFGMPCLTTQKMRHMVKVHGMEIMGGVHGRSHATIEYFVRKNKPKETFEQKHLKEHSIKSRSPKGAADVNIRHFFGRCSPNSGSQPPALQPGTEVDFAEFLAHFDEVLTPAHRQVERATWWFVPGRLWRPWPMLITGWWFRSFFIFPYLGNFIIPNWLSYFSEG